MAFNFLLGIVHSHEMFHKDSKLLFYLSFPTTVLIHFPVYPLSHVLSHHKYAGTKHDAVTCPKNKSVYQYIVDTWIEGYQFVWNYDKKKFFACISIFVAYIGIITYYSYKEYQDWDLALRKVGFFWGLSAFGFCLFESFEYIEHYGLVMRNKEDEVNEKCSWNHQENTLGNILTFKVNRHSDHHMFAYKYYSVL